MGSIHCLLYTVLSDWACNKLRDKKQSKKTTTTDGYIICKFVRSDLLLEANEDVQFYY